MDYSDLKSRFEIHFRSELNKTPKLKHLLYDIFIYGSAYIVGGYLRDFINSKVSRDMDLIIDLESERLHELISKSNVKHSINRHGGIKLHFANIDVDMWSIENNWAFKNELVRLNENDKVSCIARGCFYNYDSVVISIPKFHLDIHNYINYQKNKKLEILQKSPIYKNLNPTVEANILRAFYLKTTQGINFSLDTQKYLIDKIGQLKDDQKEPISVLEKTKSKYPKYQQDLPQKVIQNLIDDLYNGKSSDNQLFLKI